MTKAIINEAVPKSSDDYLLTPDEAYRLTFERLVLLNGRNKYVRASFDISHKVFMEIIEKYGLKPVKKWQVYNSETKRNEPYEEK